MQIEIMGYELKLTCESCPEQYDVFKGDEQVGYLRLRGGWFRADCPDCGDTTVYSAYPQGFNCFSDAEEREFFLLEAVQAIDAYWKGGGDAN